MSKNSKKKGSWDIFARTGHIDAYLEYRRKHFSRMDEDRDEDLDE